MPPLPSVFLSRPATTDDCKVLLGQLPVQMFENHDNAGTWRRRSKRGTGDRIERTFEHTTGLTALVVQTPTLLYVEALGQIDVPNWTYVQPMEPPSDPALALEAQASSLVYKAVVDTLQRASEGGYDHHHRIYSGLMTRAGRSPMGSDLRKAVGNLFVFSAPGAFDGSDHDEPIFQITARLALPGLPTPDHPHGLENFHSAFESPKESCYYFLHMTPDDAINFLLDNGFRWDGMELENIVPDYANALIRRQQAVLLRSVGNHTTGGTPPTSPRL